MKTNSRTAMLMVAAVTAAVWVGACASQPTPNCPVAVGSPIFGYPNFWASYKLESGTGSCASLKGEEVGFQKYTIPGDDNKASLAIRGYQIGGRINGEFSFEYLTPRSDSTDPDGVKANAIGEMTPFPTGNLCSTTTDVLVAEQNFDPADPVNPDDGGSLYDDDGGVISLPAETVKYEWSGVEFLSTPNIPGSAFKAELKYTQDTCVATYHVEGIWPLVRCKTDLDCSPVPVTDAGTIGLGYPQREFQGSGLNPDFFTLTPDNYSVKCDTDPTVVALLDDWTAYRGDYTPDYAAYAGSGACVVIGGYEALKARYVK